MCEKDKDFLKCCFIFLLSDLKVLKIWEMVCVFNNIGLNIVNMLNWKTGVDEKYCLSFC